VIDVQRLPDDREIPIDKVGVKGLRYPITVLDRDRGSQQTVASVNLYVNLPQHFKGTHMSRFVEVLNEHRGAIDIRDFGKLLHDIKHRLEAQSAHAELVFPYFVLKKAPVSGLEAMVDYEVAFIGSIDAQDKKSISVVMKVPITTVCPCSKEIADRGAHNQRGMVTLTVGFNNFVWIEDLIRMAEQAGSGELYALLKREDEKFCTETAFDRPRFVEDVVREIGQKLREAPDIRWFRVEVENLESIHNHNAYACVEMKKA